jgi:hypothetical protein
MESEKFDTSVGSSIEELRRRVGLFDRSIEALFTKIINAEYKLEMARRGIGGFNARISESDLAAHKNSMATQLKIRNSLALQCGIPEREHTLEELKAAKKASAEK